MLPVLHAPYPIAQKCLPQYCFCNFGCSCCNSLEVRPLNLLTRSESDFDGGYSMCMWTWSLLTTPLSILTSSASQICTSRSRHRTLISPVSTSKRYLVTHTMCAVSRVVVCPLCRLSFTGATSTTQQKCVATESLALKAHSFY